MMKCGLERDSTALNFCEVMQKKINDDTEFQHIFIPGAGEAVLLNDAHVINFCPFCGGNVFSDIKEVFK